MNSTDAFTRAALYQSCIKSEILQHIDLEKADVNTLRDLLNKYSLLNARKLPIIITKLMTKKCIEFAVLKFPKLKNTLSPEHIRVEVEEDELAYLMNTQSSFQPNIVCLVFKNIVIGALGSSIEAFKNDLLKCGNKNQMTVSCPAKIVVKAPDVKLKNVNLPQKFTDTFSTQPLTRINSSSSICSELSTTSSKRTRKSLKRPPTPNPILNNVKNNKLLNNQRKLERQQSRDKNRSNSNSDDNSELYDYDDKYTNINENDTDSLKLKKNHDITTIVEEKEFDCSIEIIENKKLPNIEIPFNTTSTNDQKSIEKSTLTEQDYNNNNNINFYSDEYDEDENLSNEKDIEMENDNLDKEEQQIEKTLSVSELNPAVMKTNTVDFMKLVTASSPELLNEDTSVNELFVNIADEEYDNNDSDDDIISIIDESPSEKKSHKIVRRERKSSVASSTKDVDNFTFDGDDF